MADVDVSDILLAIAARVSQSLDTIERDCSQNTQTLLKQVAKLLQTEIELTAEASVPGLGDVAASTEGDFSVDVGIPGVGKIKVNQEEGLSFVAPLIGKITAKAKASPEFRNKLRGYLAGSPRLLVCDQSSFGRSRGIPIMSGSSGSNNQKSLRELAWAIAMSEGQFSLILAHCNYLSLRSRSVQQLQEICAVPIRELVLHPSNQRLYSTIQQEVATQIPSALMVLGLESVDNLDYLLTSMNQVREEFRKNCPFPLVIWVNDGIVRKLIRLVPDIESWAKRTVLTYPPETLIHELHQNTNALFTNVLDLGISPFLANDAILGRGVSGEIQAALQEVKNQGRDIPETLQASLDFVWGREAYGQDKIDLALAHYQHSLAFWQQVKHFLIRYSLVATKKLFWTLLLVYYITSETPVAGDLPPQKPTLREKEGVLLFYIGLCYCRKAELDKAQSCDHWYKALFYFQQCIDGFEQVGRLDLVAKFIGQLGEVWRRLENWDELYKLAQKAQRLHKKHGNPASLAQNYGFFAEVALFEHQGNKAKAFVKKALQLSEATTEKQHHSWYLLLLARSQQQLGQVQEAIKTLETAKKAEPENNPLLYIQILNELRNLYYQQHRYLEAFDVKQCRRSIEQQFNFRAFIGAGRLQSRRQANSASGKSEHRETVAREILASGRENDIKRLIARIGSTQHKLTVIYGQSGVGKSSLVNAGLLPTLRYQNIGTDIRDILAVPLRVYTDWVKSLGKSLFKALEKRGITLSAIPDSAATLIEQLTQNGNHNLLTVLIFDQFEEFFFICSESEQKEQIFESLIEAINAGTQLSQNSTLLSNQESYKEIKSQVVAALKQSIYWIEESNRLEGHKSLVWDVSVLKHQDGQPKTLASASYDGTVILWKPDGELIQEIKAHEDRVLSVNFSPNGQILATASFDKKVKLWKTNGQGGFEDFPYKTILGHNKGVYDVSFSPDGKIIATASRDKTVKLWYLDGSFIHTLEGHDEGVNSVAFSPDNQIIATASLDNTVKLWQRTDEDKFESIRDKTLQGHSDIVWAVKFSPDGKMIATASRDNTVKLWSLDGRVARTIKGHKDSVFSMSSGSGLECGILTKW
ncbi:MAG: hypothetical protein RIE73_11370 [Coleofasciculus sp. C1-SOL-03]|uniref:nSTAND1 domain-containing NTPase n=1 Tax=Coleofasciculus sp. C1-SOL-03 TaxID=3069522 RepID=UPI0032F1D3D0